jgi:hypothetical protein
MVQLV